MSYDFHSTRREQQRTIRLSDAEIALFNSCKKRRGFEYDNHYIRALLSQDGELMGEPELVQAALAERSTQKSMALVAFPRSWEFLHAQLSDMIRAALIINPNEIPQWALRLADCCPEVVESSGNESTPELVPVSESVPKTMPRRAAFKMPYGRPVGHVKRPNENIAICGVRLAEIDLAEGTYLPCRRCAKMGGGELGVAA